MGTLREQIASILQSASDDGAILDALRNLIKGLARPMTERQRQVAELLIEGCENREIGKCLKIEERTVKAFVAQLFRRYEIGGSGGRGRANGRIKLALLLYKRQQKGVPW